MIQPLYIKIKEMIRQMAVAGTKGERLPSVAELSSRLAVNPQLVDRVFKDLQEEGYIRISEDGTFYPAQGSLASDVREKELLQQFDQVVRQLFVLSVQPEELAQRVNVLKKGDNNFDRSTSACEKLWGFPGTGRG